MSIWIPVKVKVAREPVAVGLALTMIGAMIVHARRKEYASLIMPAVLFVMAVFVAYGRFVVVPL